MRNNGEQAFFGCESLTDATIPDAKMSIGESAFQGCGCAESIFTYVHPKKAWAPIALTKWGMLADVKPTHP